LTKHLLRPHPDYPPRSIEAVEVDIVMTGRSSAELRFLVKGAGLSAPSLASSRRADELWKSTCFELFLRPVTGDAYFEFNFSPSTQWAAYAFDSHRQGRLDLPQSVEPRIDPEPAPATGAEYRLDAVVHFSEIPPTAFRMGLSAIIEETDGTKSYWALAHPPGDEPDFHDPACFALELPAAITP
jgi:hypothetical protein